MSLNGFASKAITLSYSEKYKLFKFNILGKTNLTVSQAGIGGRLTDIRSAIHRDAIKKALLSGINLVDTSSVFTDGNSEILIGEVIQELNDSNLISRESVVVVTKGGILTGKTLETANQDKKEGYPLADFIEIEKDFGYCIHPDFLTGQIKNSLERLNFKTVDIYLLNNPEYYLIWAKKQKIDKDTAQKEFYKRIKKAFEHLEKEVEKGRIKYYGISSDSLHISSDEYEFVSLEKIISIAEDVSPQNHLAVIELPMNLYENQAFLNKNQSNMSVIEFAQSKNIGVLINRPIYSNYGKKTIKLAEPIIQASPTAEFINQELENINKLEISISEKLKSVCDKDTSKEIINNLFVFEKLTQKWNTFEDIFAWKTTLNQYFLPRFHYYKNFIKNNSLKNEEMEMDLFSCVFKIGRLFSLISSYYDNQYLKFTEKIKIAAVSSMPELAEIKKLSNMAICSMISVKGVSSVLVGMPHPVYVSDTIEGLKFSAGKCPELQSVKFPD